MIVVEIKRVLCQRRDATNSLFLGYAGMKPHYLKTCTTAIYELVKCSG